MTTELEKFLDWFYKLYMPISIGFLELLIINPNEFKGMRRGEQFAMDRKKNFRPHIKVHLHTNVMID